MSTITSPIKQPLPWTPRLLKRQALSLLACGMIAVSLSPSQALAQDSDSFWTQFVPSTDTRLIFVSSSEGSDTNSGLTPDRPVKSLDHAYDLLRDGYPDWMLLKRGDVWYESLRWTWDKSGRAEDEKLIVGAYGEGRDRPQIRPAGDRRGVGTGGGDTISHVAFVGLHFEPHNREPDQGGVGIGWGRDAEDILFEDLYISGFKDNITIQPHADGVSLRNFQINGCVIVDAWNNSGHSQGLFANKIDGLIIENSVFDHNGWNVDMGADPTIFNHNIYIQLGCEEVVLRNNTIANGSSHGVQMRSGGEVSGNIFLLNPISVLFGGGYNPDNPIHGAINDNLILDGRDMSSDAPRGWAIDVQNANPVTIENNFIFNSELANMPRGLHITDSDSTYFGVHNVTVASNIFAYWANPLVLSEQNHSGMSNILIVSNTFLSASDQPGGRLVDLRDPSIPDLEFSANSYYFEENDSLLFRVDGSLRDYSYWQNDIESTSQRLDNSVPRENLGLSSYFQHLGQAWDNEIFLEKERSISRNSEYTSPRQDIIQWHHQQIER